jgi:nicotinamidase-related amidase
MTSALLVMDVQQGVVARLTGDDGYLARLSEAIAAARGAGIPVVYVTVSFRPGHPEISPRNATFAAMAAGSRLVQGDPAPRSTPPSPPQPGEVVVTKRRVSAFAASDLAVLLRARDIDTLVLA